MNNKPPELTIVQFKNEYIKNINRKNELHKELSDLEKLYYEKKTPIIKEAIGNVILQITTLDNRIDNIVKDEIKVQRRMQKRTSQKFEIQQMVGSEYEKVVKYTL